MDAGTEIWKYAYVDAQTSDFNHDDMTDIVLWSTVGNEVLLNQGKGKFKQDESLPLVYAANRAFGFHGLAADFSGAGYDDLLTVDSKRQLAFSSSTMRESSRRRHLRCRKKLLPVSKTGAGQLPFFAFVTTARLLSSGKLNLVALTMDGRVEIFEEQPGRAMSARPRSTGK